MGSIAGILYFDGRSVDRSLVEAMNGVLARREFDRKGIWHSRCYGCAGSILCTTPESQSEPIPWLGPGENFAVIVDGRLDNRPELIERLQPIAGQSASDGELIFAAWQRWGARCAEYLIGDFAFAVWAAARRVLYCARDTGGVRQLYYYHSSKLFAFATEIQALFCVPEIPRRLNEVRVADHLARLFDDPNGTYYKGIFQLPPAHALTAGPQGLQVSSYWSLDNVSDLHLQSDEEYATAFREVFFKAVSDRLRASVPVGSMLSGGLDSSSICCVSEQLLRERQGQRLKTFSAVFPSLEAKNRKINERPYIEAVLRGRSFEPHFVRADVLGPLASVQWHEDEPLPAPSLYMDLAVFQAARSAGVKALLSGNDGDTTVSYGYELLTELALHGRALRLYREARALANRTGAVAGAWKLMWVLGLRPIIPPSVIAMWRWFRHRRRPDYDTEVPIEPEFARRISLGERIRAGSLNRVQGNARKEHIRALQSGLLFYALNLLDKTAAYCSIELRFPFFDRRLMSFCVSIPASQKLQNGLNRAVMRRAMRGILPPEVEQRVVKGNMSSNFQIRLFELERKRLEELFFTDATIIGPYVDLQKLRDMYEQFIRSPQSSSQQALVLFQVAGLASWLRRARISP